MITAADEALAQSWWMTWHGTELPAFLLNTPHSLLLTHRGEPAITAFLHRTDSGMALIEPMVANPALSSEERGPLVEELSQAMVYLAHELGCNCVIAMTTSARLEKRLLNQGFHVAPGKMLMKGLK